MTQSRTSAALLAIFLGNIGVHWFYLGHTARGLVYVLFCWTFIPGFVALIRGLIWLGMDDATFRESLTR